MAPTHSRATSLWRLPLSTGEAPFDVREWVDDRLILPFLERDHLWGAYALCDLDPPFRQNTRIVGAESQGEPAGLVLLYVLPGATTLLPFGDPDAVRAILQRADLLPQRVFSIAHTTLLSVVEEAYGLESPHTMIRMAVAANDLVRPPPNPLAVARLSSSDAPEIADLYRRHGSTFFERLMIEAGIYYGVRDAENLVAVAGTHVSSVRFGLAAIGGVFTHPDFRGRGLATATTGAVAAELVRSGIDQIVLNVRQDNAPAVAAYTRLGFRPWLTFTEGSAIRR